MFGGGQGEGGEDFRRQLGEDEGVGGAKLALPAGGGEDVPAESGNPARTGEIRRGYEAVEFEEFGVAGGTGCVGDEWVQLGRGTHVGRVGVVEVDEGEHFAADGLVADPEDKVGAPLHGFDGVREGEEEGAETFGVHGGKVLDSRFRFKVRGLAPVHSPCA